MSGYGGFFVAFGAAAGLHLAALGLLPSVAGGDTAGGGGTQTLSVSVAGEAVEDLVARWEATPEVALDTDAPDAPAPTPMASFDVATDPLLRTASAAPLLPVERPAPPAQPRDTAPVAALPAPSLGAAPALPETLKAPSLARVASLATPPTALPPSLETAAPPAPDLALRTSLRPTPRQARPAVTTRATGIGTSATPGTSTRDTAARSAPSAKAQAVAEAAWAAAIQRRIARAQVYPRGARGDGRVRLALTITSNGSLAGVKVVQSSGVAAFDTAAVRAAKRAAPFPAAPDVLTKDRFAFGQWVAFQR